MTGSIAPHRHRELAMVLSGAKPLATIERDKAPYLYGAAVAAMHAGLVAGIMLSQDDRDCDAGEILITRVQTRHLLNEYLNLLRNGDGSEEYHYRIGRLFGYSDADIQAFLASEVRQTCQCGKCTGRK